MKDWGMDKLLPIVLEVGKVNLRCMELLDQANTTTYGTPVPTTVPLTIEKGPFIIITGHDLKDLQLLLEQTKDKGINIYTHGEMLPAHAYPELKKYSHLKGNFGTAWQNQRGRVCHNHGHIGFRKVDVAQHSRMPRHPYLRKLLHRRSGGAENEPQRACLHTQP
jgi:hydroxylamine reductase (hybrid-cluster protein)